MKWMGVGRAAGSAGGLGGVAAAVERRDRGVAVRGKTLSNSL